MSPRLLCACLLASLLTLGLGSAAPVSAATGSDKLTITVDPSATSYLVEKQSNGGAWSTLTTLQQPAAGITTITYTDANFQITTSPWTVCYRATPQSATGAGTTSQPCCSTFGSGPITIQCLPSAP